MMGGGLCPRLSLVGIGGLLLCLSILSILCLHRMQETGAYRCTCTSPSPYYPSPIHMLRGEFVLFAVTSVSPAG